MLALAAFCAGVLVGVIIASVSSRQRHPKKRYSELIKVRQHILAGIKESHDREIIRETFRAVATLNDELDRSLRALTQSMEKLLREVNENRQNREFAARAANKQRWQNSTSPT